MKFTRDEWNDCDLRYVEDPDHALVFQTWPDDGDIRVLAYFDDDDLADMQDALDRKPETIRAGVTCETTLLHLVKQAIEGETVISREGSRGVDPEGLADIRAVLEAALGLCDEAASNARQLKEAEPWN